MGMHIDEAWSDDPAGGINRLARRFIDLSKQRDNAVLDPHVPPITDPSATIHDRTAKNLKVEHYLLLFLLLGAAAGWTASPLSANSDAPQGARTHRHTTPSS